MSWFAAFLNSLPLWGLFLLTLVAGVAQVEAGSYVARLVLQSESAKDPDGPLGSLIGALLGLLAFMLAFTFGIAGSRFDTRRQLVLDEANAIGTTYLRAEFLPAPQRDEVRRLLREYVDVRLTIASANVNDVMKSSSDLHRRLWDQVKVIAASDMDDELRALFVQSLNEVIDLHQSRITFGLDYRVPGTVWGALYSLSCVAMLAVGYQAGNAGVRRVRAMPIVAAAFALVITLIADIDRPGEGMIWVSQKPIADVRQTME